MFCTRLERGSFSDERVLAKMESFHPVVIDRDVTPGIARRFGVMGYPCMLVLNAQEQKIHRWSGFSDTAYFLQQVDEALGKFDLYRAGKEWEPVAARPDRIAEGGSVRDLPAPHGEVEIEGLCRAAGRLWCIQRVGHEGLLIEIDPTRGEKIAEYSVPSLPGGARRLVVDLTADEERLYLASYGWSKGDGILRFDLENRRFEDERTVTAANRSNRGSSTSGIACLGDALYLCGYPGRSFVVIDKMTGEIRRKTRVGFPGKLWITRLAADGDTLLAVGKYKPLVEDAQGRPIHESTGQTAPWKFAIFRIDPVDGSVVERTELGWEARAVEAHEGDLYLSTRSVWEYNVDHERVRIFPESFSIHVFDPQE